MDYLVDGDLRSSFEMKSFHLMDQDLVYCETITLDDQFCSSEGSLSFERGEEVSSYEWHSFEIKKFKYRGYYLYVMGNFFHVLYKRAAFDFLAEEVFDNNGRRILGLPAMYVSKTSETIKEYLPTQEGQYEHVILKMCLSVFRADGKRLSELPLVFDVIRTNESNVSFINFASEALQVDPKTAPEHSMEQEI